MRLPGQVVVRGIVNWSATPSFFFAGVRQTDYVSYLADFTLATDTAAGALALQRLAEEHHCGATLTVEPYEGLRKVRLQED